MKANFIFLLSALIILTAGLLYLGFHLQPNRFYKTPDSILLMTIDTLRADHLGYQGYPRETSPFLDRFSRQSIIFHDASAQIPKTLPSMASMMTSRYPGGTNVLANFHVLPAECLTLAEVLGRHGFYSMAYTTNGNLIEARGIAQGFNEFSFRPMTAATLAGTAINRLEHDPPGKFFLWLHYNDPHGPYHPPEPFRDMFLDDEYYNRDRRVSLRYEPLEGFNKNFILGAVPEYQQKPYRNHARKEEADFYISQYDGEIRSVDSQIQSLVEYLDKKGMLDNTLVVVTADHGEGLGEHDYYFEHGWFVYQDQIHVPLLMHFPGQQEGEAVQASVELTDLAPTILDLAGIAVPQTFQGRSLMPLIKQNKPKIYPVYSITPNVYPHRYESLRLGEWKYIVDEAGREELYHLDADPAETDNLIGENHTEAVRLKKLLSAGPWRAGLDRKPQELPPETSDESVIENLKALGYLDE